MEDCIKDGHTTSFKFEDAMFNMYKDILMTCVNLLFNELFLFFFYHFNYFKHTVQQC